MTNPDPLLNQLHALTHTKAPASVQAVTAQKLAAGFAQHPLPTGTPPALTLEYAWQEFITSPASVVVAGGIGVVVLVLAVAAAATNPKSLQLFLGQAPAAAENGGHSLKSSQLEVDVLGTMIEAVTSPSDVTQISVNPESSMSSPNPPSSDQPIATVDSSPSPSPSPQVSGSPIPNDKDKKTKDYTQQSWGNGQLHRVPVEINKQAR